MANRPAFYPTTNPPAILPITEQEYTDRLTTLRHIMQQHNLSAVVLTSMHCVAYYPGFLYCAFGRPYACVVTADTAVTISAGIDAEQPARRSATDNLIYTDWQRNNYWRAVKSVTGTAGRIGIEGDHISLQQLEWLKHFLEPLAVVDLATDLMQQRLHKSAAEIALIKEGARIADIGAYAIKEVIKVGAREIDVAMAGRDAMELAIAESFPDSELRDTWVWFQSGINTDGAHNPITTRKLEHGDILSLNTFPMINGYYTALERTLFVGSVDDDSMRYWQANTGAHELGLSLLKPGNSCAGICREINDYFAERNLLQYRSFGYGHSFGVLSHYYGREAGLELREDIDTTLEAGMVISMEPMLTIPLQLPGAGGYREHDIVVLNETGAENISGFAYGPEHNIVG